jgi:hypothetical protein
MATYAAEGTAMRAAGRDVVVIQDSSELILGGKEARRNGYGPVGKGGSLSGLLLHAALTLEAGTGAAIGLLDAQVKNRYGERPKHRRARKIADKESQRWIDCTTRAAQVLSTARSITGVSDRESDIYEHFTNRPPGMHLVVRACQNRKIKTPYNSPAGSLFPYADSLPVQGWFITRIPAAPGRKARLAQLEIRFSVVELCKPRDGARGLPDTVLLNFVDVRETSKPDDSEPIHWRLLTSDPVTSVEDAHKVVDLYRLRWRIEDYFRILKTAGFSIEDADISDPRAMTNLVAAVAIAAVTIMQLVQARDGATGQSIADAFDRADQPLLEALSANLEGKTARQQNPHPKGSLAFAAWVIGRLGGWTGYYGKPGPLVMRRGLDDFQRIKYGATLRLQNV